MTIGLGHYLTVAAILFTLGIFGIFLNRKNVIVILMSIELILLAVNINLVAFSTYPRRPGRPGLRAAGAHRRGRGGRHRARHPGRLFPQPRLDRGRGHQSDEGLSRGMYQAIVFLPLLGALIAALIALVGARARFPGGSPAGPTITRMPRPAHDPRPRTRMPRRTRTRDAHAPEPAAAGLARRRARHHAAPVRLHAAVVDRLRRRRLRPSRRPHHAVHLDRLGRPQGRLGAAHRHA